MVRARLLSTIACAAIFVALQPLTPCVASAAELVAHPQMTITFDDSPSEAVSLRLAILQQRNARATFFLVGRSAEQLPQEALAIAEADMQVGNHSYDHTHTAGLSAEAIRDNLSRAQSSIASATGVTPRWYRPPYFDSNPAYEFVLPELGLRPSWGPSTINTKDWDGRSSQQIIDLVMAEKRAGGVVVMHDWGILPNSLAALPVIVDGLHEAGYRLVTLDECGLGAIEGTVTAIAGTPVSGVEVSARDAGGSVVATAATGPDGSYRVSRVAPGWHTVGFARTGHPTAFFESAVETASANAVLVPADHSVSGVSTVLDVMPPETQSQIATSPAGFVTVRFAATDDAPGAIVTHFSIDNGPEGVGPAVFVSDPGPHTLRFWSSDSAGNAEEAKSLDFAVIVPTVATAQASHPVTYRPGAPVAISARLRSESTTGPVVAGAAVGLESSISGFDGWTAEQTHHTDSDGRVTFHVAPQSTRFYRVVYGGRSDTYRPAVSAQVKVTVPRAVALSIATTVKSPSYKMASTITGTLRVGSSAGAPIGGQQVVRLQRLDGAAWRTVRSVTTESGVAVFSVAPAAKTSYRLTYAGSAGAYVPAQSPWLTITPKVSVGVPKAPAVMTRGKTYVIRGHLRPGHVPGSKPVSVYLWRKVGLTWKPAGYVRAQAYDYDGDSRYEARIKLPRRGRWRLRALAPADAGHAATWSRAFDYVNVR